MRLIVISTLDTVPWGGSEVLWAEAVLRLRAAGAEMLILRRNWEPEPEPIAHLRAVGVRFAPLADPWGSTVVERWHRWSRRFRRHTYAFRTLQSHAGFRADLVFIAQAGQYDGLPWFEACQQLNLRYALLVQVAVDSWWPAGNYISDLRRSFERAVRCFFVSRANHELTCIQLAAPLKGADVVSNPFNVPFDTAPNWPTSDTPLRLACVARLEPGSKGQDLLFRVLAQPKWRARPLHVSLYGRGAQEEVLRSAATRDALASVSFCGHTADIAAVWRDHHALILPSRCEGMPLAGIEAMLCHRPSIMTDAGGNPELIEDGVSGFIAAGASPRSLDDALERFWTRRDDLRAMGLRAGERIRQLIPRDPGAAFAEKLRQLVNK